MSLTPRVVVVHRRTEYDELIRRHGTRGQAAFFLATRDRDLGELEHRHHQTAHHDVRARLDAQPPRGRGEHRAGCLVTGPRLPSATRAGGGVPAEVARERQPHRRERDRSGVVAAEAVAQVHRRHGGRGQDHVCRSARTCRDTAGQPSAEPRRDGRENACPDERRHGIGPRREHRRHAQPHQRVRCGRRPAASGPRNVRGEHACDGDAQRRQQRAHGTDGKRVRPSVAIRATGMRCWRTRNCRWWAASYRTYVR